MICASSISSVGRHFAYSVVVLLLHHFLHEANVVILCQVSVLQEVRAVVLRHRLDKMLNNFVWNERVSKIKFRDIGLQKKTVSVPDAHF